MGAVFDPLALPPQPRAAVERALRLRDGHEEAIDALETHLAHGGERTADVLAALALCVFEDATTVVLSRIEQASEEAIRLLDEALRIADEPRIDALQHLRGLCARTLKAERERERRLWLRASSRSGGRAVEWAELSQRLLTRGGDDTTSQRCLAEALRRTEAEPCVFEEEALSA